MTVLRFISTRGNLRDSFGIHEMRSGLKSGAHVFSNVLQLGACILTIAMLLAFPAVTAHHFDEHYRTPHVRRWVVRHTCVAQPESTASDRVQPASVVETKLPATIQTESANTRFAVLEPAPDVPLIRLLLRSKLGPSRSGSSDPLL